MVEYLSNQLHLVSSFPSQYTNIYFLFQGLKASLGHERVRLLPHILNIPINLHKLPFHMFLHFMDNHCCVNIRNKADCLQTQRTHINLNAEK